MFILRRMSTVLVAVAVVLAILFAASPAAQQQDATTTAQPTQQHDIQPVADDGRFQDCLLAGAEVYAGLAGKGLKIAVSLNKFKAFFASVVGLIPGVDCGKYLGKKNVAVICWLTNRPWYVPGVLHARGLVWMITGGQTNRCT